jgi:hypothetical protein
LPQERRSSTGGATWVCAQVTSYSHEATGSLCLGIHPHPLLAANRACTARSCARLMASPNAWYAGVHGRWGSSPRPRAIHSHTVLRDTPASPHAAVKVAPRASAMVIVTCTVTFSFVGRPRARVDGPVQIQHIHAWGSLDAWTYEMASPRPSSWRISALRCSYLGFLLRPIRKSSFSGICSLANFCSKILSAMALASVSPGLK